MARGMKIVETPDPAVIEMRRSLAQRIAAHTEKEGEHTTAVPGLILYHRTSPTPCYRASYEPSLSVFVQGRKRINLGGTEYLCDGSSFLLSSIDVPAQSQIIEASEKVPLLCAYLRLRKLDSKCDLFWQVEKEIRGFYSKKGKRAGMYSRIDCNEHDCSCVRAISRTTL